MSKLDFLELSEKFTRFADAVRANRTGCDTRFAQVVHDRLIEVLESHARSCRQAVGLERLLSTETDPDTREALEDRLGFCVSDLESGGGGLYPWHLLDAVERDHDYRGNWHPIPEWKTVGDEHLNGLGVIIKQIADETGIKFTTYLCDYHIGPEGAANMDPEIYEKPIGSSTYH